MIRSGARDDTNPERAFLDANVIRGQQTTDVLLSVALEGVYEPRWTQKVIDEMRRNRPPGLPEADIDRRLRAMNTAFPDAMVEEPPRDLQDQMQADPKDKHVLAGAVHSEAGVLVTDNLKDFHPADVGPEPDAGREPEPVPHPEARGGTDADAGRSAHHGEPPPAGAEDHVGADRRDG